MTKKNLNAISDADLLPKTKAILKFYLYYLNKTRHVSDEIKKKSGNLIREIDSLLKNEKATANQRAFELLSYIKTTVNSENNSEKNHNSGFSSEATLPWQIAYPHIGKIHYWIVQSSLMQRLTSMWLSCKNKIVKTKQ